MPPRYYATLHTTPFFDCPPQNPLQIEEGINLLCHPLLSLLCHVRFMVRVLYTVLSIKTALLRDNVLYKSVQKTERGVDASQLMQQKSKKLGVMQACDRLENEMYEIR